MITTITTLGCSVSTSMWRIVALSSAGAVATASRFVISDSVSVVTRSASSSSRRTCVRVERATAPRCSGAPAGDRRVALAGVGRQAPGRGVRVGEQPPRLEHASSLRIVDGPAVELGSAASVFDATGWPVAA
jgi:hypothetical protein